MTNPDKTALSREDTRQLLQKAQGHRLEALIVLLTLYGLRSGEARALRRCDLDFERGEISINGTLHDYAPSAERRQPTKTRRSDRRLPMSPAVEEALRTHMAATPPLNTLGRGTATRSSLEGLLFTNNQGTPLTARQLSQALDDLTNAAEIPRVTPHELRHTAATVMLQQGIPIAKVSAVLGHASITTTVNEYGHLVPADAHDELAELHRELSIRIA